MNTTQQDWQERIDAARKTLEQRLDEDVSLEELADIALYSPFHFHRLFRALTGETVREHVRRLRLERAAHHLVHAATDILNIALTARYDSHEAFTRAFKSRFGIPPSEFRAQKREIRAVRITKCKEFNMDVRIESRSDEHIAFVRHTGAYNDVGAAWGTLMKWGWTKMMFGKPDTFGLCHDDPDVTPAEKLRYDACMVVDAKTKTKGDIQTRVLPAGHFAVTLHNGALDQISSTYAKLFARVESGPIQNQSWRLGDPPSLEKYLTDPRKVKPDEMKTEIWMPVHAA
ncbi:MAG: GyrI-like domain-containing protein [Phycisphaerae bacterium]